MSGQGTVTEQRRLMFTDLIDLIESLLDDALLEKETEYDTQLGVLREGNETIAVVQEGGEHYFVSVHRAGLMPRWEEAMQPGSPPPEPAR